MKNIILFAFGMFITNLCAAVTTDTIPASDPLIEYTGRIDFSNPEAPVFSYSGVSIRACFTGTGIAMIMNDNGGNNYFNLILDGKLLGTVKIETGQKIYKIAGNLENTTHEIEIFKRTEEMFGKTRFFGFVVDEGSSLTAIVNQRTKLIEYIGNSITCGYGNEGALGGTFGATTENHYMTYAAITSRNFNARHLAVCKSGIGIYRNYNGPDYGNSDNMTNYYTRIFLYDENPKYSFQEKPDLVCIDLGTNDFSTNGGDSAKFVSNYLRLIDTIQTKYVMPDILCLLGPMIGGTTLAKVRGYIMCIADSANRKGKGNVDFFEMSQQTGNLGYAIDYHPTVAQHEKNGLELTEYIKSLKGWKIYPLVLKAGITEARHIKAEFNTPLQGTMNEFSGFTIYGDSQEYAIDTVYCDPASNKIIHILLQQSMYPGEKINLSYAPGTVESEDSVSVGAINFFTVRNNLTETKVTTGAVSEDGAVIKLTFNKNINKNSFTDGLTLSCSREDIAIDSFSIAGTQIILYPGIAIIKTDTVFAGYSGNNIFAEDDVSLTGFSKLALKNNSVVTGISQSSEDYFSLFPNPNSSGIFSYNLEKTVFPEKTMIVVLGSNGIELYSQILTGHEGQLNLQGIISQGVYFIKFIFNDSVITKSVVIE